VRDYRNTEAYNCRIIILEYMPTVKLSEQLLIPLSLNLPTIKLIVLIAETRIVSRKTMARKCSLVSITLSTYKVTPISGEIAMFFQD
jgi:hypothetical protein